ncbi:MAG: VWA domain-containing protein [Phycisphaerales bacterium]
MSGLDFNGVSFAHPWMLTLLGLPVVLLVWAWQRRGTPVAMPFDHQSHRSRPLLGAGLRGFEMVPAFLLAATIIVLAGPQTLQTPKRERVLSNIQICFDVSGSMNVEDRYTMARSSVERFIDRRDGDAFGLTLFGSYQIRWTPLTRDLSAIRGGLPFADPSRQPGHMGGTMIGSALRFCMKNMQEEVTEGDKLIILVSDGVSADLGSGFAEGDVGTELAEAGIVTYHVHVGTGQVPDEMRAITRQTGGDSFVATDRRGLDEIFTHIDRMQPARFAPGGTVPMDWFAPFSLAALAGLGVHLIGLLGIRVTPW